MYTEGEQRNGWMIFCGIVYKPELRYTEVVSDDINRGVVVLVVGGVVKVGDTIVASVSNPGGPRWIHTPGIYRTSVPG